jgi:hypothetical protein
MPRVATLQEQLSSATLGPGASHTLLWPHSSHKHLQSRRSGSERWGHSSSLHSGFTLHTCSMNPAQVIQNLISSQISKCTGAWASPHTFWSSRSGAEAKHVTSGFLKNFPGDTIHRAWEQVPSPVCLGFFFFFLCLSASIFFTFLFAYIIYCDIYICAYNVS